MKNSDIIVRLMYMMAAKVAVQYFLGGVTMHPVELTLGIILLVLAVFLVVAVLMQQGKDKKLSGSIAGSSDTYYGKGKGKSWDKLISRLTTLAAVLFCGLVIAMYVVVSTLAG